MKNPPRFRLATLMTASLIGAPASQAQEQQPAFAMGVALAPCPDFVKELGNGADLGNNFTASVATQWAVGFITGTNLSTGRSMGKGYNLASLSYAEMAASLYGYCQRHPDKQLLNAVVDLQSKLSYVEIPR